MDIHIFILCFNESVLLHHTINHYRKNFPNAIITIYDNESTDNSVEIALSLGCKIITFTTKNEQNEHFQQKIKNNCWKNVKFGWIIVIDMDEWIIVKEKDLIEEEKKGVTILTTKGVDMIGESKDILLKDIDLHNINKAVDNVMISKSVCFHRNYIKEMNYHPGAHKCNPIGQIKYSNNVYIVKHMSNLGVYFLINKMKIRYQRSEKMRKFGLDIHYIKEEIDVIKYYYDQLLKSYILIHV